MYGPASVIVASAGRPRLSVASAIYGPASVTVASDRRRRDCVPASSDTTGWPQESGGVDAGSCHSWAPPAGALALCRACGAVAILNKLLETKSGVILESNRCSIGGSLLPHNCIASHYCTHYCSLLLITTFIAAHCFSLLHTLLLITALITAHCFSLLHSLLLNTAH